MGLDAGEDAAVQGEGERHHVAHAGRGHADADQEAAVLVAPHLPRVDVLGRMRRVAQRIEAAGDLRELHSLRIPADLDDCAAHVEPRLDHPRPNLRQLLDQPHAGRTVNAFQVELDRLRAVGHLLIIEFAEDLVIELGIGPTGRPRRAGFAFGGIAEAVEAFQPAAVNHLVDRAAAAAAELEFFVRLDKTRRDRQAAMGAGLVRRRPGERDVVVGCRHKRYADQIAAGSSTTTPGANPAKRTKCETLNVRRCETECT